MKADGIARLRNEMRERRGGIGKGKRKENVDCVIMRWNHWNMCRRDVECGRKVKGKAGKK